MIIFAQSLTFNDTDPISIMEVIKMNNSDNPKKVILDLFDNAGIEHESGDRQTDLEDLITAETIKEREKE